MMDFLIAALFGAVQGITEFLPISSSGHLVVLHELYPNYLNADQVGFDVALHVGTLVALVVFFRRDLALLLQAGFRWLGRRGRPEDAQDRRMILALVLATIPAAVVGAVFESVIDETFRSMVWVALWLVIGGLAFLLIERMARTGRNLESLRLRDAIWIGLVQVIAFLPGISRSGSTIVAGRALGFSHASAARFSFLLSIPVVFGAAIKKAFDTAQEGVSGELGMTMLVGGLAAVLVGLLALRFLMRFFESHTLRGFALYRFLLAAVLLGIVLFQ
jgi:undecaprenyl-diphosphatase